MHDGERVSISGSSGTPYELSRRGDVYACTCPAWAKQRLPPDKRTCKHLRAYLGDAHEDARTGDPAADARVAAAQARARKAIMRKDPLDPPELRARRKAALAAAVARFPAAVERMRATYGMPLPRHLAYGIGFWLGLTDQERDEAWAYFGNGPAGVGEWFEPGGLDRVPELDERLHYRFRRDPPEFVTVFTGSSDGSHWGLWYDDPHELPRLLAHNWARDSSENGPEKATLLASLRDHLAGSDFKPDEWKHARQVLAWLDEVHAQELAAHRDERIGPPPLRTRHTIGGLDPVVRGARIPEEFTSFNSESHRLDTYRKDPATARGWISRALEDLARGEPMRALFLARELHWSDHDDLRDEAADLGIRAYEAIGRHPLAEVLRVHVAHRDLTSVHIYRAPTLHPLVEAAAIGDEELVTLLLADDPEPATISAALGHAKQPPIVDRLLAAAAPDAAAKLLAAAVAEHARAEYWKQDPSDHAALIDHLLARGADPGPAFAQALANQQSSLASRLAALVDVTRPDPDGLLPLHHAVQAGAVAVARQLLDRGADRFARDVHGKTPHDRARDIWQTHRAESLELLALLPASPVAVAVSTDVAPGDAVTHAKFGPGVVLTCEGAGDTAKLTIDFADTQRQLLARFIRRA
jgi:hypothetical protein